MFNQNDKNKIKKILEKHFSKEECVQCYFLKTNKKFKKLDGHRHKIIFKTKKKVLSDKPQKIQKELQVEIGEDLIELVRWSDIIGKFFPASHVYKVPFFDSREIKEYTPWRICPIGYHWVKRHDRLKKNLEDVDPHCRRNPSNKDILKGEEIDFISQTDLF